MAIEVKTMDCIGEGFRLQKEFGGELIWVPRHIEPPDGHAYLVTPDGAVLNTGENGFVDATNFTDGELQDLLDAGDAQILRESI